MAVPGSGTAPLNNPDHKAEHERIIPVFDKGPRGIVTYTIGNMTGVAIGNSPTVVYQLGAVQLQAGRQYLLAFGVRAIAFGAFQSGYLPVAHFYSSPATPTGTTLTVDAYVVNIYGALYENISWEQPFIVKYDLTLPLIQILVTIMNGSSIYTDWSGHMRIEDLGADTMSRAVF